MMQACLLPDHTYVQGSEQMLICCCVQVEGHLREISLMQEELSALQASQAQTERQEEQQLAW
jgi:hypothetical protein